MTRIYYFLGVSILCLTCTAISSLGQARDRLYGHLKIIKKAEGLRQTQLKTMKEFPHPLNWAAYQLTGES